LTECASGSEFDPRKIRVSLAQLGGVLNVHLAMEDGVLYPQLLQHAEPAVRSTAKRYVEEMGALRSSYNEYVKRWSTPAAIGERRVDFVRETGALIAALTRRMAREDDELYPLADAVAESGLTRGFTDTT
jgi:hemerythrin-like domain-containing protein